MRAETTEEVVSRRASSSPAGSVPSSAEDIVEDPAEQASQLLVRRRGERLAGEKQTREEHAEGRRHADPVLEGDAGVGQHPAELVLQVLVLGVVLSPVQLLERGLVALVHEEELALGEHGVDDLIEQLAPLLEGDGLLLRHLKQGLAAELVESHVQRKE